MPREEDVIAAVEKYIDYIKNEKKVKLLQFKNFEWHF